MFRLAMRHKRAKSRFQLMIVLAYVIAIMTSLIFMLSIISLQRFILINKARHRDEHELHFNHCERIFMQFTHVFLLYWKCRQDFTYPI